MLCKTKHLTMTIRVHVSDCGVPVYPVNGSFSLMEGTQFGSKAYASCLYDLKPSPKQIVCQAHGTWSNNKVRCREQGIYITTILNISEIKVPIFHRYRIQNHFSGICFVADIVVPTTCSVYTH